MAMADLTAQRLRELLHYDPDTGFFTRLCGRKGHSVAGERAGSNRRDGYVIVGVDGKAYLGHRLAWLYCHGAWPELDLDHIDGDPHNNKLANLRCVSHAVNMRNKWRATRRSSSQILGVVKIDEDRWDANVMAAGRAIRIANLPTKEMAQLAHDFLKKLVHHDALPYVG